MTNKKNRSFMTVAFMIIAMVISKLLGMLRGVLLASSYGISEDATAFSAASRIPLSFFDIVFSSAILGCFIPIYNSFSDNQKCKKDEFASIYLNFMLLFTGLLSLIGMIFAPEILSLIAPDMLPETARISAILLRIMFPLIVFAAASYTLVGVLQSNGKFIAPSFISALSNILVIVYFLFFNEKFGIKGLAFSYTLGWIIQMLTLIFSLGKNDLNYKVLFNFKNKEFVKALKLTPLIIMGSWLAPVCMLISMRFALQINVSGAVPSFEYSINLFTVITGITTYGICNYIFPELSSLASSDDSDGFIKTCRSGLSSSLIMTVIIGACTLVLAPYAVCVIYKRGSFDIVAAQNVTAILRALVPGMIGFTLVEVLSRVFYAKKAPKYPVVSVIAGIVSNVFFSFMLCNVLPTEINVLGISYSSAILITGIIMFIFASLKMKNFSDKKYMFNFVKIIFSGVFAALSMFTICRIFRIDPYTSSFIENILFAGFTALAGIFVYFLFLCLFREENMVNVILKKIKKR